MNTPAELRKKADQYCLMRSQVTDAQTREALLILAGEYEALAERMENDADEDQRPGDDDRKGQRSDGQQSRSADGHSR